MHFNSLVFQPPVLLLQLELLLLLMLVVCLQQEP